MVILPERPLVVSHAELDSTKQHYGQVDRKWLVIKRGRLFEFCVRGEIVLDPELRLGLREE